MFTVTPAQLLAASAIVATRAATVPHLRGLADALVKEAENRARHADAADRDPLVVRDNTSGSESDPSEPYLAVRLNEGSDRLGGSAMDQRTHTHAHPEAT